MEGLPLWDIVTTLKAPPGQIDRFVAHHLRAGANRIHLIFDDPASFHFIDDPRVSCCVPGDVHWGSAGRPAALEERQIISANAVARISRADWILNSDIDEYLDADRPVSELLSEQPEEVCALTVWPVEPPLHRVSANAGGHLLGPVFQGPGQAIHGDQEFLARALWRDRGYQQRRILGPQKRQIPRAHAVDPRNEREPPSSCL